MDNHYINSLCVSAEESKTWLYIDGVAVPTYIVEQERRRQKPKYNAMYTVPVSPPEGTCLGSHLNVYFLIIYNHIDTIYSYTTRQHATAFCIKLDFLNICTIRLDHITNKRTMKSGTFNEATAKRFSPKKYEILVAPWLKWLPSGEEINKLLDESNLEAVKLKSINGPLGAITFNG